MYLKRYKNPNVYECITYVYSMLGKINTPIVSNDKAEPNGLPTWQFFYNIITLERSTFCRN
jgi:hypothetical protein